jgi:hypothetical protein
MIISCKTGACVPRPPSIDSNEDREMDLNNHNDNMDRDIPARQFPTAQSGPIAQFLNGIIVIHWYARLDETDELFQG